MSEVQQQALLPLQRAMRVLTSEQQSSCCDEDEMEFQMAAMRILANVSWVLEIINKANSQREPLDSN